MRTATAAHVLPRVGLLLAFAAGAAAALAQGRVVIDPPRERPRPGPGQTMLQLKELHVQVQVTDGVAVSNVKQVFRNPLGYAVEGTYIFPLPEDVAVGDFSMTVGGKTLTGEVLDANQARQTYEDIVRRLRDPGLLEYIGSRMFRARVFPIPPNSIVEVTLSYSQTLRERNGLGLYRQPLQLDAGGTVDAVTIDATVTSHLPLLSVFSPSHTCTVTQKDSHHAEVSYSDKQVQGSDDFLLYYQRQDAEFGLAVLTHRAAAEPGTFLLRISPRVDVKAEQVLPKDIAFVLDTSGSMSGEKFEQAQRALQFCINSLNANDRFNIYPFATRVASFRDGLVPASPEVLDAARVFVNDLRATGSTNINEALLTALKDNPGDPERMYIIVFVTDGLPQIGVTNPEEIRKNVTTANTANVRIHVLGVGSDVNTHLLDKIAEDTRGTREYCTEKEDLEIKLSDLAERLSAPVLANPELAFEGVEILETYPVQLPDLFRGESLVVTGRYTGGGPATVRLTGRTPDRQVTLGYETEFPDLNAENDFLPRLWASRKIAYLLDEMRLHGENQEAVDEVTELATRYGIVTPYTAALIVEDTPMGGPPAASGSSMEWPRVRDRGRGASGGRFGGVPGGGRFARSPAAEPAVGRDAVETSRALRRAQEAETADATKTLRDEDGKPVIRHVGEKAFVNVDGRWTDTTWKEQEQKPRRVEAFSAAYFELLKSHPQRALLKRCLALGERVLVVLGDEALEIVPPEPEQPATAPAGDATE